MAPGWDPSSRKLTQAKAPAAAAAWRAVRPSCVGNGVVVVRGQAVNKCVLSLSMVTELDSQGSSAEGRASNTARRSYAVPEGTDRTRWCAFRASALSARLVARVQERPGGLQEAPRDLDVVAGARQVQRGGAGLIVCARCGARPAAAAVIARSCQEECVASSYAEPLVSAHGTAPAHLVLQRRDEPSRQQNPDILLLPGLRRGVQRPAAAR